MNKNEFINQVVATLRKVNDLILDRQWAVAELHLRASLRATSAHLGREHPLYGEIRKRIRRLFETEINYNEKRNEACEI